MIAVEHWIMGDLRQLCKQFIHLSHICLCVNCIMMYILTNISHPDPVAGIPVRSVCVSSTFAARVWQGWHVPAYMYMYLC